MDTKSTGVGIILLALLATILGIIVFPTVSPDFAFHGGTTGILGGHMSKILGIFLYPLALCLLFAVWYLIPKMEPMYKNLDTFRHEYNGFWFVMAIFFFYLFALTIGQQVGWEFDFRQAVAPAIALVFASASILLEHSRRNYLVGIRTPWTLSSDKVWKRTNVLGSKLFLLCAVWTFAGAIYPNHLLWFLVIPLILTIFITTIFSYVEFRRLESVPY